MKKEKYNEFQTALTGCSFFDYIINEFIYLSKPRYRRRKKFKCSLNLIPFLLSLNIGYGVGVAQRSNNNAYHSDQRGNALYVDCKNLDNNAACYVYNQIRSRGFKLSKNSKHDGYIIMAWYNNRTKQNVKTSEHHTTVISIKMNSDMCR